MLSTSTTFTHLPDSRKSEIFSKLMENRAQSLFFISSLANHPERTEVFSNGKDTALLCSGFAVLMLSDDTEFASAVTEYTKPQVIVSSENAIRALSERFGELYQEKHANRMIKDSSSSYSYPEPEYRHLSSTRDFLALFRLLKKESMLPDFYEESEKHVLAEEYASKPFPAEAIGIYRDGKLVSAGYTAHESRICADIVGVTTDSEYRRQGLALSVVEALSSSLLAEDSLSFIGLSYSSEESHKLYLKAGFEDAGKLSYLTRASLLP